MNWTPFESTLYLDADTVLLGRVDYGFAAAEQFGVSCCINENPWANRHGGITVETVEYNAGVLFFTKRAKPIFDKWEEIAGKIDSSVLFYRDGELCRMNVNDQAGLAAAFRIMAFNPHVLPLNFNYRPAWQPRFCGPIKIWHDWSPVAAGADEWNADQTKPDAVIQQGKFEIGS
jgi:lipopolysaccharide biosynthesis glycosyltransferase